MRETSALCDMSLLKPYRPVAVYYEDADSVEYLRREATCVYRRIDGVLTLAFDMFSKELVGFRIKGFKNFYLRHLAANYDLVDAHFVMLVSVVEKAVEVMGEHLFQNESVRQAYMQAREIALTDKVELHDLPEAA